MTKPASRLLTLILLLQDRPNRKAAELASELGVSVRTLHRYFEMLDDMGIPVYSERGPYGGFSLVRGYKMPPLVLSPEESVAVALGAGMVEELWGQLYRDSARGALAKLENLLPDEQRREVAWARRTLVATGMHRADLQAQSPFLEKLRRAIRERRQARMEYHSGSQPHPAQRDFDPYALVHRWGWWYVIGYCRLRRAVRTFRVDRIAGLELLDEGFDLPSDFDLDLYLASEPHGQAQFTARLRFAPESASAALGNRSYWERIEEAADGSVEVTFSTPTLEWAASTCLAYGPAVEVLEPPELRRMVVAWAQAIAGKYTGEKKRT
ncbi:MAG: helix-turn-helix transcriptional regulator [Chloroflexota bacterium]